MPFVKHEGWEEHVHAHVCVSLKSQWSIWQGQTSKHLDITHPPSVTFECVQSVQTLPNEKQQKIAARKVFKISCSFLRALSFLLESDFFAQFVWQFLMLPESQRLHCKTCSAEGKIQTKSSQHDLDWEYRNANLFCAQKAIIEESFFFDSFCPLFDASALTGVL